METLDVKTEVAVAKPTAQIKAPIAFGGQGVQLASLDEAYRFANAVVASGFAPRGMEKPESVLIAIQLGMELGMTPMPLVGEEFLAFIQAENRRWGPLIKAGKITVE